MSRKDDPDFMELIEKRVTLNEETGALHFDKIYAQMCFNITHKGKMVVVPYSHIVWLKKHKRWPIKGMHVDHIDDNPQNNRPDNLQELTEENSHKKRRGRMVYRTYGTGKYGYEIQVTYDRRDRRYYVTRHWSSGHGGGDLRGIKRSFGGYFSLKDAEHKVEIIIEEIKDRGIDYIPPTGGRNVPPKIHTLEEKIETRKIRSLRKLGKPYQVIAKEIGRSLTYVYNRCNNLLKET